MFSLMQIKSENPNLRIIWGHQMVETGYITAKEHDDYYKKIATQEQKDPYAMAVEEHYIDKLPDAVIAGVLKQTIGIVLVLTVEAIPPIKGYYSFPIDTIEESNGETESTLIAYIEESEISDDCMAAIVDRLQELQEASRKAAEEYALNKAFAAALCESFNDMIARAITEEPESAKDGPKVAAQEVKLIFGKAKPPM